MDTHHLSNLISPWRIQHTSYKYAGTLSHSHTSFVHQVLITTEWTYAAWNQKFAQQFYAWPVVWIKSQTFWSRVQCPLFTMSQAVFNMIWDMKLNCQTFPRFCSYSLATVVAFGKFWWTYIYSAPTLNPKAEIPIPRCRLNHGISAVISDKLILHGATITVAWETHGCLILGHTLGVGVQECRTAAVSWKTIKWSEHGNMIFFPKKWFCQNKGMEWIPSNPASSITQH